MDVIVSPELPVNDHIRFYQRMAAAALKENSAWHSTGASVLELVAVLVPNENDVVPLLQFALRDGNDGAIRTIVDITKEGGPIPLLPIIQSSEPYIEAELFLTIAKHTCSAAALLDRDTHHAALQ